MRRRAVTRSAAAALAGGVLAAGGTGCGADGPPYANRDRPPAPVTVTAAIDETAVRVSPARVRAGPVRLLVANLSDRPHRLTFETADVSGASGIRASAPIAAHATAELRVDPRRGAYRVGVRQRSVRPAVVRVGAPRASAQDRLLLP